MLCPRPRQATCKNAIYPPPESYLHACKPAEGQAWVHVICSVFVPKVNYSNAQRLRLVEGVSTIPQCRWAKVCLSRMLPCNVRRLIYLCRTVRYATKTEERLFAAASVRRSTTSPARRSRAVNSDSDAGSDLPSTRTLLRSCSCCI